MRESIEKQTKDAGLTWLGSAKSDDPIFKEGWSVSIMPQSGQKSPEPSTSVQNKAADELEEPDCELRDEDSGEETERPSSETVIDPEDGLFQAMEELKEKLGPKKFFELLSEAFPLRKE